MKSNILPALIVLVLSSCSSQNERVLLKENFHDENAASTITSEIDRYEHYIFVTPIKQKDNMACWATALTMLHNWKNNSTMSVKDVVQKYGDNYAILYETGAGIMPKDEEILYKKVGLTVFKSGNPTIQHWHNLLKSNGPLSITVDADPTPPYQMIHALVVNGIKGDGTANGTIVTYIDPGDGKEHKEKFSDFLKLYEGSANWPLQIIYWP